MTPLFEVITTFVKGQKGTPGSVDTPYKPSSTLGQSARLKRGAFQKASGAPEPKTKTNLPKVESRPEMTFWFPMFLWCTLPRAVRTLTVCQLVGFLLNH